MEGSSKSTAHVFLVFLLFVSIKCGEGGRGDEILSPFVCLWLGRARSGSSTIVTFPICWRVHVLFSRPCDVRVVISKPR